MNLGLHLLIHIFFSLLAGFIMFFIWKKPIVSFASGILGGFIIDLDHFIDYFLAFGWSFDLGYFIKGYQFLKSDKIYILLHGWEHVIIFMVLAIWVIKNKTVHPVKSAKGGVEQFNRAKSAILALAIGLFFHLSIDSLTNEGVKLSTYSITYRVKNNFDLEKLVTPEHWQDHQERKSSVDFK